MDTAKPKSEDALEITYNIPSSEVTLLVQVDPKDAKEWEGAVGAVGRLETDDQGSTCMPCGS